MNKKMMVLLSVMLLCSCNQVKPVESTTSENTEKSDVVPEPKVTLTAKEGETEQGVIIHKATEMIYADFPTTFSCTVVNAFSMWDRFTRILSMDDFNVEYLNKTKETFLSKQSEEVRYGLSYAHDGKGTTNTTTVDGIKNKYGYYCVVFKCYDATKYELTYQEDDKKVTFNMWLPKKKCDVLYSIKYYETIEEYSKDVSKYCLEY